MIWLTRLRSLYNLLNFYVDCRKYIEQTIYYVVAPSIVQQIDMQLDFVLTKKYDL